MQEKSRWIKWLRSNHVQPACHRELGYMDFPQLHWVPVPKFTDPTVKANQKTFSALYGKKTEEKDRPSHSSGVDKDRDFRKILVKEKVRYKIICTSC